MFKKTYVKNVKKNIQYKKRCLVYKNCLFTLQNEHHVFGKCYCVFKKVFTTCI